jgi:hypothetical protein
MSSGSTTSKVIGTVIAALVAGVFITVSYYLYVYSYDNPDPNSCWVMKDLQSAAKTKATVIAKGAEMNVAPSEGYPVEMHKIYLAWFRWGFWSSVVISVLFVVFGGLMAAKKPVGNIIGGISCGIYLLNVIIWLAFGAIWRYSPAGKTASGDFLVREGGIGDSYWDA